MDIKREPPKKTKRYLALAGGLVAVVVVSVAIGRLQPAAPTVERGTLWFGVVTKGPWKREVNAPGTLVPEHVRYVVATTSGRVEALPVHPGEQVTPATVLVELSNPDEQIQLLQKQQTLDQAIANLASLKTQLQQTRLSEEGTIASLKTQYQKALRDAAVLDSLNKKKLTSANEVSTAHEAAEDLKNRLAIEERRLTSMQESEGQQLELQAQQIGGLRAILTNQKERVASMRVGAPERASSRRWGTRTRWSWASGSTRGPSSRAWCSRGSSRPSYGSRRRRPRTSPWGSGP